MKCLVLFISINLLTLLSYANDCTSSYDKKNNIGYYCATYKLSFAYRESGANEICMENVKREVESSTIVIFDDERVKFSCKMSQQELNKIIQKEQEKKVLQEKVAKEKEDKERSDLIKSAKEKCANIGFAASTEKFGKCVLELIK